MLLNNAINCYNDTCYSATLSTTNTTRTGRGFESGPLWWTGAGV